MKHHITFHKHCISNNERRAVANLARTALRHKYLEDCYICSVEKTEHLHHKDYSKPLDVIPLCNSCHGKAHGRGHLEANYTDWWFSKDDFDWVCGLIE